MEPQTTIVDDRDTDSPSALQSLEQAVNDGLRDIAGNKREIKKRQDMVNDALMANGEYAQSVADVKAAQKTKRMLKMKVISHDTNLVRMTEEIKDLRQVNRETQLSLSDYLFSIGEITGGNTFQTASGELVEFEKVAKIRAKKQ